MIKRTQTSEAGSIRSSKLLFSSCCSGYMGGSGRSAIGTSKGNHSTGDSRTACTVGTVSKTEPEVDIAT
jgi:hypothetical protein